MRPTDQPAETPSAGERPHWSAVIRALREARGATQDGWAARLGVSRKTVQRWERGERVPDPGAEAAIVAYGAEMGLLRTYDRGPLAGIDLTAERLRAFLAEARWGMDERRPGAPAAADGTIEPDATPAPANGGAAGPAPPAPTSDAAAGDASPAAASPASGAPVSSLPASLTRFIGRERDVAAVRRLQAGTRLLTLTGAGGVGKTRLALRVADELLWAYPHGVWLVELAALADPALVPQTVATALGLPVAEPAPPADGLIGFLRPRQFLLLLDNCEHLAAACAELTEAILRGCPGAEVLATSRVPLGVAGETVWRVPPMAVPGSAFGVRRSAFGENAAGESGVDATGADAERRTPDAERDDPDAIRLFEERARLYRPEFALTPANREAVAEICRRLDGIPLAIELAAARISMLSAEQIAARLGDRLRLLTGGSRTALPRHQTMRAALDWSYALLSPEERALLRRLSVFAGGFTLEAAETVGNREQGTRREQGTGNREQWEATGTVPCSLFPVPSSSPVPSSDVLDTLASLVDQSLVVVEEEDGAARYRLLETVRQYAGELLDEAGETEGARDAHLAWCVGLAQAAEGAFRGPDEPSWLARLERDHDNLRAALRWALLRGGGEASLRLAAALARFWEMRGYLEEGRQWLMQALTADGAPPPELRAKGLEGAGVLAYMQGDYASARALFEQSLALQRDATNRRGIANTWGNLGRAALRQGDYATARDSLEASLALNAEIGHKPGIADAEFTLGVIALRQGDYGAAGARFGASLSLNRELGNAEGIANALEELATVLGEQGDDDGRQAALLEESLALYRALGDRSGIATIYGHLGTGAWARGEHDRARQLLEESLALYRAVGDRRGVARMLANQSFVALYQRDHARAAALCRESLALYWDVGDGWAIGKYLPVLASAALGLGQLDRAARLFGAATTLRERHGASLPPVARPGHDRAVAAVRASLGEAAFIASWAEGQAMSAERAVGYALEGVHG